MSDPVLLSASSPSKKKRNKPDAIRHPACFVGEENKEKEEL